MFKQINAGDMRTIITVENVAKTPDGKGTFTEVWTNVFGTGKTARCQWINAHGTEADENNRLGLHKKATLTMRYSPLITDTCRVKKGTEVWEVESIDDIEDNRTWLEVKIKRVGVAI